MPQNVKNLYFFLMSLFRWPNFYLVLTLVIKHKENDINEKKLPGPILPPLGLGYKARVCYQSRTFLIRLSASACMEWN